MQEKYIKWFYVIFFVVGITAMVYLGYEIIKPIHLKTEAPSDHINEDDITAFNNTFCVNVREQYYVSTFGDTNSMVPTIDVGSNAIEIIPKSYSDISIGDIISFKVEGDNINIIHRVIFVGRDEVGIYFKTKGDATFIEDDYKVRFKDIDGIVVAIIY